MTLTTALRLYGKQDIRLETFDLGEIGDNEILADVQTDSICMSTYKAYNLGPEHKRIPDNVAENPVIVGHELSGVILAVGKNHQSKYRPGQKYSIQPAMYYPGREFEAPGYSFAKLGGDATKVIIPSEIMEMDCLLPYEGEGHFKASLAEPVSCVIGGFNTMYHYKQGTYNHVMGPVKNGRMLILGGTGPMGLAAIDYALHGPYNPKLLVVTDISADRLARAESLFPVEAAAKRGTRLIYAGVPAVTNDDLKAMADGVGFDDAFVFAPVTPLVEQAAAVLTLNGCLNFFAGPTDTTFSAKLNFYDVHYNEIHVACNSGGNTEDMLDALRLMGDGTLEPAVLITHIGGLDAAAETIAHLPQIPGGKKLIYTHLEFPLIALDDLAKRADENAMYGKLAEIVARHNGLWSNEAEAVLLAEAPRHNIPPKS
ncbi:MAG: zinc-binding dehydrogenase [Candidatus Hydrogenedentes bacterium]|nr:zinc-binding dehydrogenase [Candidatus Hydrogenedentota bacterium]